MAFVPFGDAAAVAAAVAADVVAAVGGDGLLVWVDLLRGGDSVGCCGYCPLTWEVCASNPVSESDLEARRSVYPAVHHPSTVVVVVETTRDGDHRDVTSASEGDAMKR